jgi:phosphoribosylanthranilate isomerase
VDLNSAATWMSRLPQPVSRVVLLVNAPLEEALATGALPFVDMVQFHGDESAEYTAAFARGCPKPFLRAIALKAGEPLPELDALGTPNVLLDASVPGAFGGTGVRVDWDLARHAVERFHRLRIYLAGGLTPENVEEAVRRVRPYAVDVASGVEAGQPGRKDPEKMASFVRAARGPGERG